MILRSWEPLDVNSVTCCSSGYCSATWIHSPCWPSPPPRYASPRDSASELDSPSYTGLYSRRPTGSPEFSTPLRNQPNVPATSVQSLKSSSPAPSSLSKLYLPSSGWLWNHQALASTTPPEIRFELLSYYRVWQKYGNFWFLTALFNFEKVSTNIGFY